MAQMPVVFKRAARSPEGAKKCKNLHFS